jgi:hypothetical protein
MLTGPTFVYNFIQLQPDWPITGTQPRMTNERHFVTSLFDTEITLTWLFFEPKVKTNIIGPNRHQIQRRTINWIDVFQRLHDETT